MSHAIKLLLRVVALCAFIAAAPAGAASTPIRVVMTPAFLNDQHALLGEWRGYLESRLKRPVEFLNRDRYRDAMDLLQKQKVDFGWICDYPYVMLRKDVRLLAMPVVQGKATYHAYLIVPARDTHTRTIADLKGAAFAFADPYSNSGYLAPRHELKRNGEDPATFFGRTFFTWSHRKAIDAVAAGLAQGASVDSHVWDSLAKVRPEITARTRIVWKSEAYGSPPFVAHRNVTNADFEAVQGALMAMKNDPQGRALLVRLNLDGFIAGTPDLYDAVDRMIKLFGEP